MTIHTESKSLLSGSAPTCSRAFKDLLGFLERQAHGAKAGEKGPTARSAGQSSLLGFVGQPQVRVEKDPIAEEVKNALAAIDPDSMSPRQAHEAIYDLQKILEGKR